MSPAVTALSLGFTILFLITYNIAVG